MDETTHHGVGALALAGAASAVPLPGTRPAAAALPRPTSEPSAVPHPPPPSDASPAASPAASLARFASRAAAWRAAASGALWALLGGASPAAAQPEDVDPEPLVRASATAVPMTTRLDPALGGVARTEGYVSQPSIMVHARLPGTPLRLTATVNLEGLTLRRGELWGGVYGEGYVDRRHPHTFLHELVASASGRVPALPGGLRASLSAGKGFAPFGTDDPMLRPLARYPVNHHLAQILERLIVVGAVRAPRVLVEAGLFNGDEPTGPGAWPRAGRFGDSWAVRASVLAVGRAEAGAWTAEGVELQGSFASVTSPELPDGGLLDQRKASLSLRAARGAPLGLAGLGERADGDYLLVEWARTDAMSDGERVRHAGFRQQSVLAEGGVRRWGVELVARAERTARPEDERLDDPFRSAVPHTDYSILGVTEWRILTAGVAVPLRVGPRDRALRLAPFVELSRLAPREVVRPTVFEPSRFYGASVMHSVTAGVRLGVGTPHRRMGRYGVAATHGAHARSHPSHQPSSP